ncbi:DEKNAAC104022 [Brettanomyces naardenensis]|uniref:DEKNAAC104022 n=1 Tax=Brettanomyces naardenensis TaxID=13370 RepID=A0A448YQ56_BRENA|nr:DEKNAAC104022 [Brettanomyces naardenensis]
MPTIDSDSENEEEKIATRVSRLPSRRPKRANSSSLESSDKTRSRTSSSFGFSDCFMSRPRKISTLADPSILSAFSSSSDYFSHHRHIRHVPDIRLLSTTELIMFLIPHYTSPLPDVDLLFPWLHGIHRNNYAQLQFLGRPINQQTTAVAADNSSSSDSDTSSTGSSNDDLGDRLISPRVPTGVRNLMVVRSCNSKGEVSSEYSDIITESTGLIRGTVSADDILMSSQSVQDLDLYLRSILGDTDGKEIHGISLDTLVEDCTLTKLVPVFKDLDPQFGVSLRNFHIQVAKTSNLSDLVVYCFNEDHSQCAEEASKLKPSSFDFSSKCCKCASLARLLYIAQTLYAEEHPEIRTKSQASTYHTFLLEDPSQQRLEQANLLAIPVMNTRTSLKAPEDLFSEYDLNVFNNWDSNYLYRERLEISKMSTATPISTGNVWLGNITDYECLQIRLGNGEKFPAETHYRRPSVPLYCNPSNTVVTLTKRDLELTTSGSPLKELDSRLITLPKTCWKLFVHCFEGSVFPSLADLKGLFTKDPVEQIHLEFPPSGSLTLADMSENDILAVVNVCKLCYFRCSDKFPALFYCSDGYTETSLLAICFVMYAEGISLDEALIKLHTRYGRPFFIFKTDYVLLAKLECVLHAYSPITNESTSFTMEKDTSKIKSILLAPRRRNFVSRGRAGDSAGSFTTSTGRHVVQLRGQSTRNCIGSNVRQTASSVSNYGGALEPVMGSLPSRILPHLYLGSLSHACCLSMLSKLGINYIISVGEQIPWIDNLRYETSVTDSNCEVLTFPAHQKDFESGDECHVTQVMRINNISDDGVGTLTTTINDALEFLDRCYHNNGKVLIHCQVGVSRSATVCIAEVMRRLNVSLPRAYMFVRVRRLNVIIQPNLKLVYELFKWEELFVRSKRPGSAGTNFRNRFSSASSSLSSTSSSVFTASNGSERSSITTVAGSIRSRMGSSDETVQADTERIKTSILTVDLGNAEPIISNTPEFLREVDWCILCREIFNLNRAYIKPAY